MVVPLSRPIQPDRIKWVNQVEQLVQLGPPPPEDSPWRPQVRAGPW
jgi:hypothetical protein